MNLFPEHWMSDKDREKLLHDDEEICPECREVRAKNGACGC